jgi:hypothetical protein
MSEGKGLLRVIKANAWVLASLVSVNASAGFLGFGGTSWKEEILLHDGSRIIAVRSIDRGGRHEVGQQPPVKEESMAFTLSATKERIIWKSEFSVDIGYADFQPLLLDIVQGTAYVVTSPVGCLAYNKWARPNPPYVIFKYQNKTWQRITMQELPVELSKPNLIISSPDNEVEKMDKDYVTVAMVQQANSDLPQPEFKTILRLPLAYAGHSCPEMVRVEGGWVSPGGAKAPIPLMPRNPSDVKK